MIVFLEHYWLYNFVSNIQLYRVHYLNSIEIISGYKKRSRDVLRELSTAAEIARPNKPPPRAVVLCLVVSLYGSTTFEILLPWYVHVTVTGRVLPKYTGKFTIEGAFMLATYPTPLRLHGTFISSVLPPSATLQALTLTES